MSKRLIAMIVAALAVVALVAGCGGGSDSDGGDSSAATTEAAESGGGGNDSGGAAALSKAEFIKQGDQICTKAATTFAKGIAEFMAENGLSETEEPSAEQQEELITEVILPAYQTQVDELAALGPPEGEEEQVEEIVTGYEDAIADAEGDLSGAIAEDPFADVKEQAADFGFTVCGEG